MIARAPLPSAAAADTLALADGTRLSLRQVGAGEGAGLAALFAGLTPESRYQRFLSPKRKLTPRELTFFTDIDRLNHDAIAAVDQRDDSIVGVARYVRDATRADVAELAIEVADAFHGMGIGTALTTLMIQRAHASGLKSLTATTLWENRAARGLLRHHGFRARRSRGPEIEHELELEFEESIPRRSGVGARKPGSDCAGSGPPLCITDGGTTGSRMTTSDSSNGKRQFTSHQPKGTTRVHAPLRAGMQTSTHTTPVRHRRGCRGAELT